MVQTQPYGFNAPRRHSLQGLTTTLTVLFAIFVAIEAVGTGVYVWTGGIYNRLADGGFVSDGETNAADIAGVAHGGVLVAMHIGTAVVFIIWQFRHATNARTLGVYGGLAHPGWAIGGWFVPIANFILPARQLFRSSRPPGVAPSSRATAVIVWWAIAFWLSRGVDRVAWQRWQDGDNWTAEGLRDLAVSEYLGAAASALNLAAAILALLMVRMLTRRQNAAFDSWVEDERSRSYRATA